MPVPEYVFDAPLKLRFPHDTSPEPLRLSDEEVERIAEKVVQLMERQKLQVEVSRLMRTWPLVNQ